MNNRFFQQTEQFLKPMTDIMALNAKTFEALAEKQTGFMSEIWSDGLNYAKDMSSQRDATSFYASQKDFWETMNHKFSTTAQDSYQLLAEAQERMTELVQDSFAAVDFAGAADSFAETARSSQRAAQDTAQTTARSASKAAQKTQSQASKTASKAAESASSGGSQSASS